MQWISTDLEDLEAGDIEHTDEVLSLVLGVERLVDTGHEPREHLAVDGLGQRSDRVDDLASQS